MRKAILVPFLVIKNNGTYILSKKTKINIITFLFVYALRKALLWTCPAKYSPGTFPTYTEAVWHYNIQKNRTKYLHCRNDNRRYT